MPRKKGSINIGLFCRNCKKQLYDGQKQYCSQSCKNVVVKQKPIDGYKPCLWCAKEFPFRYSAKVRSAFCKRLGVFVGSVKRQFCSKPCSISYRNTFDNPSKREDVRKENSRRSKLRDFSFLRTPEARAKQRLTITGSGHWNWQGGKTKQTTIERNRKETKDWRRAVFERDNWTCQDCGARNGNGKTVKLNADHIKPWSLFPELRHVLANGRTLCVPCHSKTDTYMGRIKNYKKTRDLVASG